MKKANLLILCLVLGLGLAFSGLAQVAYGCEGCTPGYWKNHTDSWPGAYDPDDLFSGAFYGAGHDITLLEALNAHGKDGDRSPQENALLRHAVAALLNAAHLDVGYQGGTACQVIGMVIAVYISEDFESLKDYFADYNERICPLD